MRTLRWYNDDNCFSTTQWLILINYKLVQNLVEYFHNYNKDFAKVSPLCASHKSIFLWEVKGSLYDLCNCHLKVFFFFPEPSAVNLLLKENNKHKKSFSSHWGILDKYFYNISRWQNAFKNWHDVYLTHQQ